MPLTILEVSSMHGLARLRKRWNELHARAHPVTPFTSFAWVEAWAECYGPGASMPGRELLILAVEDEGTLVGIAPFFLERTTRRGVPVRVVQSIGDADVGADHLDLLTEPSQREQVVKAVFQQLWSTRRRWDLVDLTLDSGRGTPELLLALAQQAGAWVELLDHQRCPYLALPVSWDRYLERFGGRARYNLKAYRRKLLSCARVLTIDEPRAIGPHLDEMVRLNRSQPRERGGQAGFAAAPFEAFHRRILPALVEQGVARLWAAQLGDRTIADLYALDWDGRRFFYHTAFDPSFARLRAGQVLIGMAIEDAIEDGLSVFDFMRGDEPYKALWARHARWDQRLRVAAPSMSARLWRGADWGVSQARRARDALPAHWWAEADRVFPADLRARVVAHLPAAVGTGLILLSERLRPVR